MTLQEHNHLVIVDGKNGKVIKHFSTGSVNLNQVDIENHKALCLMVHRLECMSQMRLSDERSITANEGDYNGGSRGFTIFHKDGLVLIESGMDFEKQDIMAGHYPEKRSGKKGYEP